MAFKNKLREHRTNCNLTQSELADRIGVSQKTISSWEVGRSAPTLKELMCLCSVFNCTLANIADIRERIVEEIPIEDIYAKISSLSYIELLNLKVYVTNVLEERRKRRKEKRL